MIIADYQVHSTASDGNWYPRMVVEEAHSKGLVEIALTDHNTTYGVKEAIDTGKKLGVRVIPAIEIATTYEYNGLKLDQFEVLGFGVELERIQPLVDEFDSRRRESLMKVIESFNLYVEQDFASQNPLKSFKMNSPSKLSVEELIEWKNQWSSFNQDSPYISDWELAFFLFGKFSPELEVEKRILQGRELDVWRSIRSEYNFLFFRNVEKIPMQRALYEIQKSGGYSVIAHPGRTPGYENGLVKEWLEPKQNWFNESVVGPFGLIKSMQKFGLRGIEQYFYFGNDQPQAESHELINAYFLRMAEVLDMGVTYGSDCHGPRGRSPFIGLFGSDKTLNLF